MIFRWHGVMRQKCTEMMTCKSLVVESPKINIEEPQTTSEGKQIDVLTSKIPLKNARGQISGVLGIYIDITDRVKLNLELVKAKEKAEESDRLKSAFLANMSHEIRTPMNGILGFAGLLKEPKLSDTEQQNFIAIIEKSGQRMLNIINDIIDISKIEAGQMKVDLSNSNINQQIEYIYKFFIPEVEAKGLKLNYKTTLSVNDSIIHTDREKVFAILTNLVKNAIKYCDYGTIEFGYTLKGEFLEFYVKDTGIGIAEDRQSAIFERFIQADIGDKRAFQGAGLGLSITKAYVEMLGGKIWVKSVFGMGSVFYFTLPYKPESGDISVIHNLVPVEGKLNSEKLKILIAEDDHISERLISIAVKNWCREQINVKTGFAAVEASRNNPDIDLILMDVKMPGMSGYEAVKKIREFNKSVVIIAQTAFGLLGEKEIALEAGCNDYIAKPIKIAILKDLISSYFKDLLRLPGK